jgi:hypothetical protein
MFPLRSSFVSEIKILEFGEMHGDSEHVMFTEISEFVELPSIPSSSAPCETTSCATKKAVLSFELVTNARADSLAKVLSTSWSLVACEN